ncbi:MAG: YkgJ family cysteine cluster protein [Methanomicrobiales archaeon]|nr:YkgJ family cysteine cluster protein [Methanomicrobiales archaeon]
MALFVCSRCGKCCQNLGRYIRVERELEEGNYYCQCTLTREYFYARTAGEKSGIEENAPPDQFPCPFLIREDEGRFACRIYPSRPSFCRDYRCSNMDILDSHGEVRGKVGGKRSLITRDPNLASIWDEKIRPIRGENSGWGREVQLLLEKEGYKVILYE